MKSQDNLLLPLLHDVGRKCGIAPDNDIRYVMSRCEYEGDSFLTITLPTFMRAFERSLDEGRLCSNEFQGFDLDTRGLPRFLGGFLRRVFTPSGAIRPTSADVVQSIWAIRQVCGLYGKLSSVCSDERVAFAMQRFVSVDATVPCAFSSWDLQEFLESFHSLFDRGLDQAQQRFMSHEPLPFKHGPGAVQDGTRMNAKYSCNTWTDRLDRVLPAQENLSVSLHDFLDQDFQYLSEEEEPPVRVIPVPKTMKTPRLIAIEPVWTQYVQQGVMAVLTSELSRLPSWKKMGWTDQERNRSLSRDTRYCTIDLSDASDSVSSTLVYMMLDRYPILRDIVFASRSSVASLPDGTLVPLRKFASMGSALCFPIETMVFTTICHMAVRRARKELSTYVPDNDVLRHLYDVYSVYGDDMIVHVDVMPYLVRLLDLFGFRVNIHKSFGKGLFRESCGFDSYDGLCVNITRVRYDLSAIKRHSEEALGLFSLHNAFLSNGLEECASTVRAKLVKLGLGVYAPWGSLAFAMWTSDLSQVRVRTNPHLQKLEIKAVVPSFTLQKDPLDHYGALRKSFLHSLAGFQAEPMKRGHLERAGRPQCVNNHIGWVDPAMDPRD